MPPSRRALRAPLLGVCALLLTWSGAFGATTYSGILNIPISTSYAGIYLDFDDANDASSFSGPSGYGHTVLTEADAVGGADWDVNFFFSGLGIAYSEDFRPFVDDDPSITNHSQILNVAVGTTVDSSSAAGQILGAGGYGGSGSPAGSSLGEDHFTAPGTSNPNYSDFDVNTPGYLAFVADIDGTTMYGWMRVTFQDNGTTAGTIHDWVISDTGIDVGTIPEPGAALLIVLGSAAFLRRRRA